LRLDSDFGLGRLLVKFHVVTTTNAKGWEETGRRMAESFIARWPAECQPLTIYAEDFDPDIEGVSVRRLPEWVGEFKAKYAGVPSANGRPRGDYDYRFDAVKFCHKVGAMTDFGCDLTDGVMIWLDADTFTHADVTEEWLKNLFPDPAYLAWLERRGSHPETGFVMFRCGHPYHASFLESFRHIYTSGDLFKIGETHDAAALFWVAMTKFRSCKIPQPFNLSGDASRTSHPLIHALGDCLDHLKGARKQEGKSRKRDLIFRRNEPYWQDVR
jgi:hypothetical protein